MSMEKNLNKFLEELIQEVEKELDEATATGNVAGYNVPGAFSNGGAKDKKRKKKISTQFGMKIVGKMDEDSINEAKDEVTPKQLSKIQNDIKKINRRIKVYISKHPATKGKLQIELGGDHSFGDGDDREIQKIDKVLKKHTGTVHTGTIFMESIVNEAKAKRPVNRWLELKNDETMHPHKKMAMGLKELKYQLRETEKFFNWYNKIKTMNELDSDNYWKRTNKHIYKIKERLINIARTIQEIEK